MPHHVIHVGFRKCASTALQAWFAAHPDIAYLPEQFGGYRGTMDLLAGAWAEGAIPDVLVTSCEDFTEPPTPGESSAADLAAAREWVCNRLRTLFRPATVLIVTRSHDSVLPSWYAQYIRGGGPQSLRALDRRRRRGLGAPAQDVYDYDGVIALYERAFGADHVCVMPYELLRDDPARFISQLEDVLGVPHRQLTPPHVYPSISPTELNWYRRWSFVASLAGFCGPYGRRVLHRYQRALARGTLRPLATALARFTPAALNPPPPIESPEVLERCRARAAALVTRPGYAPYRDEYLGGPALRV
jgi:hypothetical protein